MHVAHGKDEGESGGGGGGSVYYASVVDGKEL